MEQLSTTVVDYGNGIYAIDQQMVRAFLIVGTRRALLIDTGAAKTDMQAYIRGITPLPVDLILTHSDGDHLGNLQDFTEAFVHPNDREAVRAHENGKSVELRAVSEGDVFDLGGRTLKVLFTPGHTPGSVCLLEENEKILFSGDSVSHGPVFMFGAKRNMQDFLQSLRRLKRMKDEGAITSVYCCHNVCPIPAEAVEDLIACAEGILDKTITGEPANMPLPVGDKTLVGRFGNGAILFQ